MSRSRTLLLGVAVPVVAALLAVPPLGAQRPTETFGFVVPFPLGARTPFQSLTLVDTRLLPWPFAVVPITATFTSPDDPTGFFEGPYAGWSSVLRDANGVPSRLSISFTADPGLPVLARFTGACVVGGTDAPARLGVQAFLNTALVGTALYNSAGTLLSSLPPATLSEACLGSTVPPLQAPLLFDRLVISSTAPDFFVPTVFVTGTLIATPEPATVTLVAVGALLLGAAARRRRC